MANTERDDERKLLALRAAIMVGVEDATAGRVVEVPEGEELAFVQSLGCDD